MRLITSKYIPLIDCIKGNIYEVIGRNLKIGIFDGVKFIGIYHKKISSNLISEIHVDVVPNGIVKPIEFLNIKIDENDLENKNLILKILKNIKLPKYHESVCGNCNSYVQYTSEEIIFNAMSKFDNIKCCKCGELINVVKWRKLNGE